MKKRLSLPTLVSLCACVLLVAAAVPPAPEIGATIPDFKLKDYNGKEHALADSTGKIIVLAFTSQRCPVSRGHEAALAKTAEQYQAKGVVFLSIDSNKDTTPDQMKEYASSSNSTGKLLPYPILKDVGNRVADAMGASRTPELYIIGKDGKLAYHGALDSGDNMAAAGYSNYVAKALDELLAGKPVTMTTKSAYGCGINRVG